MTAAAPPVGASTTAGASTTTWYALSPEDAVRQQGVEVDKGLTSAEADKRRAKVGPNKFTAAKQASRAQQFLGQYADPMQIVLARRGHRLPVPAGAVLHRPHAPAAHAGQRRDGPEPGEQGVIGR